MKLTEIERTIIVINIIGGENPSDATYGGKR